MAKIPVLVLVVSFWCAYMLSYLGFSEGTDIVRLPLHHRYTSAKAAWTNGLRGEAHVNASKLTLLQAAVTRSSVRANALMNNGRRLSKKRSLQSAALPNLTQTGDYIEPLVSGGGDYWTEIELGTPATTQVVVLDTGSDLVWVQCRPCTECFEQQGAIFNPESSSSFEELSCASAECETLPYYGCGYDASECVYEYAYGDGSESIGDLATETLTLETAAGDEVSFSPFVFGCGHENAATFAEEGGPAGILGMGRGSLSLAMQLGSYVRGRFAYCLVPYFSTSESLLELGYGEVPAAARFTPILRDGPANYYYVGLQGISVGGERLAIPEAVFGVSEEGGGSIFDSGTTLTYLPPEAYERVVEAMEETVDATAVESPVEGLGLCYEGGSSSSGIEFPSLEFHFEGGVRMRVPAENYMVEVDEQGTLCLIVVDSGEDFSILGNLQQQNFRMFYDLHASRIGFVHTDCAAASSSSSSSSTFKQEQPIDVVPRHRSLRTSQPR